MGIKPTREQAYELLTEFNQSDALIKHALAVEGVMRHFAEMLKEDVEKWGVIGLIHDLDYQMYPEEHCSKSAELLKERGIDGEYIHAVISHGYGICSDTAPVHIMEKVLFTIDELTGLINASVLMRPDKSIVGFELKSLKKKYKTPSFAAGVDRGVIERGVQMLLEEKPDMTFEFVCTETIKGMQNVADAIGLSGT